MMTAVHQPTCDTTALQTHHSCTRRGSAAKGTDARAAGPVRPVRRVIATPFIATTSTADHLDDGEGILEIRLEERAADEEAEDADPGQRRDRALGMPHVGERAPPDRPERAR